MKACMLWEKDMAGHMDEPLQQTAKDFTARYAGSGTYKVSINTVIPTPTYPKNVGLRKRHEKITDSKVTVLMD
jgi:hypothetical protein